MTLADLTRKFMRDFRHFMFANSVLSAAAGFSIGTALKQFIEELMDKILKPVIAVGFDMLKHRIFRFVSTANNAMANTAFERFHFVFDIIWSIIMFASIIILTFVFLEYVFNKEILGMRTRVRTNDQDDYSASRVQAKIERVLPNSDSSREDVLAERVDFERGLIVIEKEKERTNYLDKV